VELYLHSPNTPSWRGAKLKKHRNNFTFLTFIENKAARVAHRDYTIVLDYRGSIPGKGNNEIFFSLPRSDRLSGPLNLLSKGFRRHLRPRGKEAGA
jgi:hypothetical protein